jgi:hypothetical protein
VSAVRFLVWNIVFQSSRSITRSAGSMPKKFVFYTKPSIRFFIATPTPVNVWFSSSWPSCFDLLPSEILLVDLTGRAKERGRHRTEYIKKTEQQREHTGK